MDTCNHIRNYTNDIISHGVNGVRSRSVPHDSQRHACTSMLIAVIIMNQNVFPQMHAFSAYFRYRTCSDQKQE